MTPTYRRPRRPVITWLKDLHASWQFHVLAGYLVMIFAVGGDGRSDSVFAALLWPASILVTSLGLTSLTWQEVRSHRWLFGIAAACLGLAAAHIVPLPPQLFAQLTGRDIVLAIDQAAGLQGTWRALTLTPSAGWQSLWSLAVPLATLILAVQVDERGHRKLLGLVLTLGLASAVLAMLQMLGDPQGPLYFHQITNNGTAVGLFANRNHQAVFLACLFPILAAWAATGPRRQQKPGSSKRPERTLIALLAGVCLVPLILITGSRAGLITGTIAVCSIPLVWAGRVARPSARNPNSLLTTAIRVLPTVVILVVITLAATTIWFGRAEAWDRLFGSDVAEDLRVKVLPTATAMVWDYFPWGSGNGSFERVYQLHEPDALLMPVVMNRAHDDWLETVLVGGAPALMVLTIAVTVWLGRAAGVLQRQAIPRSTVLARAGLVIVLLFAVASISDYPLRIPSLACLFVCAAVWTKRGLRAPLEREATSRRDDDNGELVFGNDAVRPPTDGTAFPDPIF